MKHVIVRTDQSGGYLAKPGRENSYTNNLIHARTFDSLEEAKEECCPGNEVPVSVDSLMK